MYSRELIGPRKHGSALEQQNPKIEIVTIPPSPFRTGMSMRERERERRQPRPDHAQHNLEYEYKVPFAHS